MMDATQKDIQQDAHVWAWRSFNAMRNIRNNFADHWVRQFEKKLNIKHP